MRQRVLFHRLWERAGERGGKPAPLAPLGENRLRAEYVQGDYEDSDLCLRLAEAGRSSWYLSTVALYHLEGQSYAPSIRRVANQYNMWLHSHIWGDRITALIEGA